MRLAESAGRGWLIKTAGCAGIAIVAIYLVGLALEATFSPLRTLGQSVQCQANVIHLTRALRMYADDYSDRFPPSAGWMDRTEFYAAEERRFHCPSVSREGEDRFGYAMNSRLSARTRASLETPDETPLVYDSTNLARNAADPFASLPDPPRHITRGRKEAPSRRVNWVGYAGGVTQTHPPTRERNAQP